MSVKVKTILMGGIAACIMVTMGCSGNSYAALQAVNRTGVSEIVTPLNVEDPVACVKSIMASRNYKKLLTTTAVGAKFLGNGMAASQDQSYLLLNEGDAIEKRENASGLERYLQGRMASSSEEAHQKAVRYSVIADMVLRPMMGTLLGCAPAAKPPGPKI